MRVRVRMKASRRGRWWWYKGDERHSVVNVDDDALCGSYRGIRCERVGVVAQSVVR